MIFKFELAKMEHICCYTNALLEFETDYSIKDKFIESIEQAIDIYKKSKFEFTKLDQSYDEFNKIIDLCISYLEDKKKCVLADEKCYKKIIFSPSDYLDNLIK